MIIVEDAKYGVGCAIVSCVIVLALVLYVVPKIFGGPPQLAKSYQGTLHQTEGNLSATFTLTSIQEGQNVSASNFGNLVGQATFRPELIPNGAFAGNIRGDKTMDFQIGDFFFTAHEVDSVQSLSGTYAEQVTDPTTHKMTVGKSGTWQLTASS